jgi:putative ABC transport system substrate-binding protein
MRRGDFLGVLGSTAALWPFAASTQTERMRHIGALISGAQNDPQMQMRLAAFRQGLEKLGWFEGRNLHIDVRFGGGRPDQYPRMAKELIALQPEAIFAQTTTIIEILMRETRTIPIVFVSVSDPVGSRLVTSLARPGGNVTGLMLYEEGITGKWLAMLKEIAPNVTRVALMANPKTTPYDYFVRSAQTVKTALSIELLPTPIESAADIQRGIESLARVPNGGLVMLPSSTGIEHRDLIIALTASTACPRSIHSGSLSPPEGSCPTAPKSPIRIGRQHPMSTGSCVVPSLPTCRCRCRANTKPSSIGRSQRQSASMYRRHCWCAPTR